MKKKDLYKIIKESLSKILKEQQKLQMPNKALPNKNPQALGACASTSPYGTINVYSNDGLCNPQPITDSFICCSANNSADNIAGPINDLTFPFGTISINIAQNCYPPDGEGMDNGPIVDGQFTYAQFAEYCETYGGLDYPLGVGGYNIVDGETSGCNVEIGGCPHPSSGNYVEGSLGCMDESGNFIGGGNNIDCCAFTGCGAAASTPPANNLSGGVPATGVFEEILPNENASYWVDDGSCLFPPQCTEQAILINGISYPTTTGLLYPAGDFPTTWIVTGSPNYTSDLTGGSCNVEVCANEYFNGLVDNLNVLVNTSYALSTGNYNNHTVVNLNNLCTVEVCADNTYDNWYENWLDVEYSGNVISNNDLCANNEIEGCTNEEACNYDLTATTDNGSCTYPQDGFDCNGVEIPILGCTNPNSNPIGDVGIYNSEANEDDGTCVFNYCLTEGNANYICIVAPDLCTENNVYDNTILGTFNSSTCTPFVYGCMDDTLNSFGNNEATNYNSLSDEPCNGQNIPCTGALPTAYAEANNLENPIQNIAQNPFGCCCQYIPGCIKPDAVNYNPNATQNDGSCIETVEGCTSPGFDNYNPLANTDNGTCQYSGCMMETSPTLASIQTESPYTEYVCLNDTQILNPNTNESFTVGEWLCNCGANSMIENNPCSGLSNFDTTLGTFIDTSVGYNSDTSELNPLSPGYPYTETNTGNCQTLIDYLGCNNNGTPFYQQNQGGGNIVEMELTNWVENATDDGSCEYTACTNPYALNYFCVDNPGLCTNDVSLFDAACEMNPDNYPDGLPTCLNNKYGNLNMPSDFECELPESYICGDKGCMDPGDGTGEYSTLNQCEQSCNICSTVQVETCQGTFTKTFDCLFIDGEMGDPDCNTSGLYCVGQEFEIPEFSGFGPPLTGTTTDSQGNAVSIDRPRPNEKFSNRTYRVLSITNQILAVPEQQGTSTTCSELGGERPRDPQRPDDDNWCGTDIDIEGNSVIDNPQAKVTINCCSEEGYPTPYTMLNSVYQTLCTVSGVLNPLNHLEFCEEKTGGTYGIPPCNYVTPIDPDRGERPPDEPMPDDPDFYGDEGNTINESKINKLREIIKKIIKNQK